MTICPKRSKGVCFALAIISFASTALAAPFTYNPQDLLLGFRKSGAADYVVNLGPATQFGTNNSFTITNCPPSVLTNLFTNLDNISFSFFSDFRSNASVTLWLSRPRTNLNTQTTPWDRRGSTAQATTAGNIDAIAAGAAFTSTNYPVGPDNTNNAVAITNTTLAVSGLTSYTVGIGSGDFGGKFPGIVENTTPAGFSSNTAPIRSDLYLLDPAPLGTIAGTFRGYFEFRPDGSISFTSATNSSGTNTPPHTGPDCNHLAVERALDAGGIVALSCSGLTLTNTIAISNTVTLDGGSQQTVINTSGTNGFRLFTVESGANLTLQNLTFIGGQSTNGGALFISSGGQLTVSNCVFLGNRAVGADGEDGAAGKDGRFGGDGRAGRAGFPAFGAAIGNRGRVAIFNSLFITNVALGGKGGDGGDGGSGSEKGGKGGNGGRPSPAFGGAIWNAGLLLLSNSSFYGNLVRGGDGGVGGAGSGNDGGDGFYGAGGWGAAVYSSNQLTVVGCTFATNVAQGASGSKGASKDRIAKGGGGGGPANGGAICNAGTAAMTNSTFFGNLALGGTGGDGGDGSKAAGGGNGGNANGGSVYSSRSMLVVNCSFSSGVAIGGTNGPAGAGPNRPRRAKLGGNHGGNIARVGGTFELMNTLLTSAVAGGNGYGRIKDKGYNVSSDNSIPFTRKSTSRKKTSTDLESSLQDNGGPTLTLALQTTNQNRLPTTAGYPPTDQRGTNKPFILGSLASIGAYEFTPAGPAAIVTRPTNQRVPQSSTVTFTAGIRGQLPITLQWFFNSQLLFSTNYTTNLPGFGPTNLFPRFTNSFVVTTNVSPFDAGLYTVVVSNAFTTNPPAASASLSLAPLLVWGDTNNGLMNVPPQATNLFSISAGFAHMLALRNNGTVLAWGAGSTNSGTNSQFGQSIVPSGLANVGAISAGGFHSLALKADFTVTAWGNNQFGQTTVPAGTSNIVEIAAGQFHSLARNADGTVSAWGAGSPGSSANNNYGQATIPTNLNNVLAIAGGGFHSLALSNFSVFAWGAGTNNSGTNNQFAQSLVPTNIPSLTTNFPSVRAIAAGQFHSLALLMDGTVVGWGLNADGQVTGTNSPTITTGLVSIAGTVLTNVAAIRAGYSNSMALLRDGSVVIWGKQPPRPPGLTNGVDIAAGGSQLAFLLNDGSPTIVEQPLNLILLTNDFGALSVSAVGAPPLRYQWYTTDNPSFTNQLIAGETNFSLSVTSSVPTNRHYFIVITNAIGSTTSFLAQVTFTDGSPFFFTEPQSQSVVTGRTATLTSKAFGVPDPTYQWFEMILLTNGNLIITNTFVITNETSPVLKFSRTQPTNEYFYVVASNSVNVATSVTAQVMYTISTGPSLPSLAASKLSEDGLAAPKPGASLASPALAAPSIGKSGFSFSFPTVSGVTYIIDYKTSLNDTNWLPLSTNPGSGRIYTHTDPATTPNRFYRVRIQ